MAFSKGQSGNPARRRRGATNKTTRAFREAVTLVFDQLGEEHLLAWARKNPGGFYTIAARMVPPGSAVNLGPLGGTLADQGAAVLQAMAAGRITPEQASTIMSAIAAQARIIEVDDLEQRVAVLEEKNREKKS